MGKIRCSVCQKALATVGLYIAPKDSIFVLCGDCRAVEVEVESESIFNKINWDDLPAAPEGLTRDGW